jgi:hypothetical protein
MKLIFYYSGLIIFILLVSVGMTGQKTKIVDRYYLVEGETKSIQSICYGNIIKIPSQVLAYGFSDSFLVARTLEYNENISYYIIDRTKDFELAMERDYRTGPLSEQEFLQKWKNRLDIKLVTVR